MSRAAKQSILILIVLVLAAFVFAGLTLFEKQGILKNKADLEKQVADFQSREKEQLLKSKELQDKLAQVEAAKTELEQQVGSVNNQVQGLNDQISKLTAEKDDLQKRAATAQQERDGLLAKLQDRKESAATDVQNESAARIAELEKALADKEAELAKALSEAQDVEQSAVQTASAVYGDDQDNYWAQILKEKATLEVSLEKIKSELSGNSVQVVELKKQNSDLQLELSKLKNEKEAIEREIKYGKDLSDTLSLELARAKNDKKFLNDRAEKMGHENADLREQIKALTSTKIALEKSIVQMQDEKKEIEQKLAETENVIQNRIDEIWQIKDSLDKKFKPTQSSGKSNSVELPPIVVSPEDAEEIPEGSQNEKTAGFNGNIVSINNENNFVIVDIGEKAGIRIGDALSVYRGAEYVAALEVIQVRKDIAAADIKDRVAKIQVGDVVR